MIKNTYVREKIYMFTTIWTLELKSQGHFSLVREIKSIGSKLKLDFAQF